MADFIRQIQRAKRSIARWPKWMRDAARMATASFPKRTKEVQRG